MKVFQIIALTLSSAGLLAWAAPFPASSVEERTVSLQVPGAVPKCSKATTGTKIVGSDNVDISPICAEQTW